MEKWKHPPLIKIYEAIGTAADDRITFEGHEAKVFSSSGNKFYTVTYDEGTQSISSNDNGSFWTGNLGYPAIAFLMKLKILPYEKEVGELLKNIKWKDINQSFKNNFDQTIQFILSSKTESERRLLDKYVATLDAHITKLSLNKLESKLKPPAGY